ncbi:hypothetical protein KP509_17G061700 [Ceratopteris richardii]|uniref:Sulfite exporter TauE/SafE family protein n=1 Tax=Ceratopteris richardii TaxID=49495 RepID=A0A8T2SYR5_CERRI|nr:hypothetical protein KP509_17G061700 [Ceratopteris richardii]
MAMIARPVSFFYVFISFFISCWARQVSGSAWNASRSTGIVHSDQYMYLWHVSADEEALGTWRIIAGLLCGAVATALSSAGGIGGGGLYVPIFNLVLGFSSKTSAALSSCMIVGGTIVNVIWYSFQREETGIRPLVDHDVALLCLPNILLGISAGVMGNVASPSWLVTALLIVVLFFMTFRSCRNAFRRWNKESSCTVPSQHLISKLNVNGDVVTDSPVDHEDDLVTPLNGIKYSFPDVIKPCTSAKDLEISLLEPQVNPEPLFPWLKVGMLCGTWIAFLAVQLVRGSSDGQNFLGIETCGMTYWIVTGMQLPLAVVVTAVILLQQLKKNKERETSIAEEAGSLMETDSMILLPVYALVAGFLGGMLGLGGGMIISPLLLEMGLHPQVTAATCSYMVFFSASLSVIQFWLLGQIRSVYALVSASLALVFSVIGLSVIQTVISKYGRCSLIVFSVSTVMGISAVLMAFFGTWDVIVQIEEHAYMGFHSPC